MFAIGKQQPCHRTQKHHLLLACCLLTPFCLLVPRSSEGPDGEFVLQLQRCFAAPFCLPYANSCFFVSQGLDKAVEEVKHRMSRYSVT